MKLNAIRFTAVTLATFTLIIGCNYTVNKNPSQGSPAPEGPKKSTRLPGFEELSASVLNGKCFTCHDGKHGRIADLHTYPLFHTELEGAADRISSTDPRFMMPPPGWPQLTAPEKTLILDWIKAGGPENGAEALPASPTPEPSPGPTTTPAASPTPEPSATPGASPIASPGPNPTPSPAPGPVLNYANVYAHVLQPNCASCHDGDNSSPDPTMSDAGSVIAYAKTIKRFVTRSDKKKMPPPNKPQLTPVQLKMLLDWIDAGAPK